jgi:hypothetical protein
MCCITTSVQSLCVAAGFWDNQKRLWLECCICSASLLAMLKTGPVKSGSHDCDYSCRALPNLFGGVVYSFMCHHRYAFAHLSLQCLVRLFAFWSMPFELQEDGIIWYLMDVMSGTESAHCDVHVLQIEWLCCSMGASDENVKGISFNWETRVM